MAVIGLDNISDPKNWPETNPKIWVNPIGPEVNNWIDPELLFLIAISEEPVLNPTRNENIMSIQKYLKCNIYLKILVIIILINILIVKTKIIN